MGIGAESLASALEEDQCEVLVDVKGAEDHLSTSFENPMRAAGVAIGSVCALVSTPAVRRSTSALPGTGV